MYERNIVYRASTLFSLLCFVENLVHYIWTCYLQRRHDWDFEVGVSSFACTCHRTCRKGFAYVAEIFGVHWKHAGPDFELVAPHRDFEWLNFGVAVPLSISVGHTHVLSSTNNMCCFEHELVNDVFESLPFFAAHLLFSTLSVTFPSSKDKHKHAHQTHSKLLTMLWRKGLFERGVGMSMKPPLYYKKLSYAIP